MAGSPGGVWALSHGRKPAETKTPETREPRRGDGRWTQTFRCRGVSVAPDILPDVSHRRVAQPEGSKRRSAVSNSATRVVKTTTAGTLEPPAACNAQAGSKCVDAAISTRSCRPPSTRGTRRSPVRSSVPAQKSERTSPHEGSHIRSTGSRRTASGNKGKRRRGATAMDQGRDKRSGSRGTSGANTEQWR